MDLIRRIKRGNEDAYMHMVREHSPSLRAYLAPKVYGHQDLDDIVQEVFIAAYNARAQLHSESQLEAWLKGIARNKLKLFYRTQSRRLKMTDRFAAFVVASIEEEISSVKVDDKSILAQCIRKLPEKLRRLVKLRHLEGVKVKKIAELQECSESQISVNLFRARQKLRECVEMNQ
jgi:RNA polymerase sigma-70 factor (ECF subfamily)